MDREVVRNLRFGVWTGLDFISLGSDENRVSRAGAELTIDTRVDPMLSRQAVYLRTAVERLGVRGSEAPRRTLIDASTYIGGPLGSIFVVRVYRDGADRPVPSYLKMLRGRDMTLRGFRAATAVGDITAAGTLELRVPVTAPLSVGKIGVRAFVDAATVYDAGSRLRDQRFVRGAGGGVWVAATVIRFALDVARVSGGDTRVQLSSGLFF
jgi:outer membrane protein assembly factor BamA